MPWDRPPRRPSTLDFGPRCMTRPYLDDPKDAVNVSVQFSAIPGGPNHVSQQTIDGVSKQLNIVMQNSNYQHL